MPAFVGLANWMIPLMIGAPDMALPRMNNWSLLDPAVRVRLLLLTLFMEGGGAGGGWTFYPPLSTTGRLNVAFFVFAVHMMGISPRSWARSTSSPPSSTCAPRAWTC
jgi:cytochrome c oxidase subunit 1